MRGRAEGEGWGLTEAAAAPPWASRQHFISNPAAALAASSTGCEGAFMAADTVASKAVPSQARVHPAFIHRAEAGAMANAAEEAEGANASGVGRAALAAFENIFPRRPVRDAHSLACAWRPADSLLFARAPIV